MESLILKICPVGKAGIPAWEARAVTADTPAADVRVWAVPAGRAALAAVVPAWEDPADRAALMAVIPARAMKVIIRIQIRTELQLIRKCPRAVLEADIPVWAVIGDPAADPATRVVRSIRIIQKVMRTQAQPNQKCLRAALAAVAPAEWAVREWEAAEDTADAPAVWEDLVGADVPVTVVPEDTDRICRVRQIPR